MIQRDLYLNQIIAFIDRPMVKIITGIRRSGKSVLMKLLRDELLRRQVEECQIIYLNFESFESSAIENAEQLYAHVKNSFVPGKRCYILLDEIQEVMRWEKAVNSFLTDFDADIFITGSNSRLLSSELATYLAGRYVEIHIYPLSFSESLLFNEIRTGEKNVDIHDAFKRFFRLGGFPVLWIADYSPETAAKIVSDIYASVILRDTIQRNNIRDVELLERVVRFVIDNVGNKFSARNVADYFKSQQRRIDLNTVYNYLSALENAFIIDRIPRYDVKRKEILKTQEKFFVGDHGIIYAVMGFRDRLISGVLENIVMFELKRRGYKVFTGKLDDKEIDFIAEKQGNKLYIQVTYRMSEKTTIDREFTPLLLIKDHYPKYVVSMDDFWTDNIEGVRHAHIADFLRMDEY